MKISIKQKNNFNLETPNFVDLENVCWVCPFVTIKRKNRFCLITKIKTYPTIINSCPLKKGPITVTLKNIIKGKLNEKIK